MSNQPPHAPPAPGTILAGKYRVERVLGQGGMGLVVEARHLALDERVALKFLLPAFAAHPEASVRFLREARAAVKIKGEHVARVSDVGTLETGAPYMVMELLEGTDLSRRIADHGVLGVEDAVDYTIQACEALVEAHGHGIVHRDVKPANLFLIKRPDGTPLVKLLDFGISKNTASGVDALTRTAAMMGSVRYMSPEQIQESRSVDHRTDVYAMGVSVYELLTARQPFRGETIPQFTAEILLGTPTPLRSLRPDVPEGLASVLEKAYARDRSVRFQSIGELVLALAPYAAVRSRVTIASIATMAGLPVPPSSVPAAAHPTAAPGAGSSGVSIATPSASAGPSRGPRVAAVALVVVLAVASGGVYLARVRAGVSASIPGSSTLPAATAPIAPSVTAIALEAPVAPPTSAVETAPPAPPMLPPPPTTAPSAGHTATKGSAAAGGHTLPPTPEPSSSGKSPTHLDVGF
jgi:serine/threonine-protein kinase